MLKELKYFFYISIIFFFLFFTIRYYFSDTNKKISYRSINEISKKIDNFSENLKTLKSDTENIIEYVESNKDENKNKKKYYFWELFTNND